METECVPHGIGGGALPDDSDTVCYIDQPGFPARGESRTNLCAPVARSHPIVTPRDVADGRVSALGGDDFSDTSGFVGVTTGRVVTSPRCAFFAIVPTRSASGIEKMCDDHGRGNHGTDQSKR